MSMRKDVVDFLSGQSVPVPAKEIVSFLAQKHPEKKNLNVFRATVTNLYKAGAVCRTKERLYFVQKDTHVDTKKVGMIIETASEEKDGDPLLDAIIRYFTARDGTADFGSLVAAMTKDGYVCGHDRHRDVGRVLRETRHEKGGAKFTLVRNATWQLVPSVVVPTPFIATSCSKNSRIAVSCEYLMMNKKEKVLYQDLQN